MRLVGVLPNPELAATFGQYLQSLGIAARVDEVQQQPATWEIWVRDEDQVARSKNELERFVANPRASEFVSIATSSVKKLAAPAPQVPRVRFDPYADTGHHPIVTLGLIVMCVAVALAIPFKPHDEYEKFRQWNLHDQLLYEPAYIGVPKQQIPPPFSALREGQLWRLFTPALMHGFWTHLIMNMMMLFAYGTVIEKRAGSLTMLLLCLFLAAFSNTAQYSVNVIEGQPFPSRFLGMSGVIFGLFGYAWIRTYYAQPGDAWDGLVTMQQVYFMLIFALVCLTGIFDAVANTAHFSGMFGGMLWAWAGAMYQKQAARNKVMLK
jgi:GlpG protein